MTKDLVCGMDVEEKKAANSSYNGKNYYFCSPSCKWAFDNNPREFAKG